VGSQSALRAALAVPQRRNLSTGQLRALEGKCFSLFASQGLWGLLWLANPQLGRSPVSLWARTSAPLQSVRRSDHVENSVKFRRRPFLYYLRLAIAKLMVSQHSVLSSEFGARCDRNNVL
jgi:hypothetical protein